MQMRFFSLRILIPVVALAALAIACGGGGGGTSAPEDTSSVGKPAAAPVETDSGTITLGVSTIRGQAGKVLLALVSREGGGPQLARACIQIRGDSFSISSAQMLDMPAGGDPCGGSTQPKALPEGRYTLTAGIYTPGSQSADKQVSQAVEVKGDVIATLNGDALSR